MPTNHLTQYPTSSAGGVSRQDRAFNRTVANIDRSKSLALVDLEARAQIEAGRIHAIGFIGQQAMQAVAMVSQLEGQLAAIVPLATGRLQGLADLTALAIAQVVGDSARRLS